MKQQRLGVVMDPIQTIHPEKDTTLVLLLEAQRRNYQLYYMEQPNIFSRDGKIFAHMRELQVYDDSKKWFSFGKPVLQPLSYLDIILMRKDPPVDLFYIYTTHLLELAEKDGVRVINKPQSLRDANEKLFINWFPQCCVPTLITASASQIKEFLAEQEDVILKPIDEMGGRSVFRVKKSEKNINVIIEILTKWGTQQAVAQRYIPEVTQGDKRIILINGDYLPYGLARMPAKGEVRANLAAGGKGVGVELTERDRWICSQVGPVLKQKEILFAGIDVIGEYLTEINVTSPTCLREINHFSGLNNTAIFFDSF